MKNNKIIILISLFIVILLLGFVSKSAFNKMNEAGDVKLPVPRFVTLKSDEVNIRVGPGVRYPIKLVFKKEGLPVEIVKEFDIWRQIRNIEGDEGWVNKGLLSSRRNVIIKDYMRTVYKKPAMFSKPIVKLKPGVIANLVTCKDNWCNIKVAGYNGWISQEQIWGVYLNEVFKE